MNSFGVKAESTFISKFPVNDLRKYATLNSINIYDKKNKLIAKSALFTKIKAHFKKEQQKLEEAYGVKYLPWTINDMLNIVTPYVFVRAKTSISTQDLLDSLPEVELPQSRRISPAFKVPQPDKPHELDVYVPHRRLPAGAKMIRKEEGMSKTEKTRVRKAIQAEIDYLSDLLDAF